jgi:hypothetical protein
MLGNTAQQNFFDLVLAMFSHDDQVGPNTLRARTTATRRGTM